MSLLPESLINEIKYILKIMTILSCCETLMFKMVKSPQGNKNKESYMIFLLLKTEANTRKTKEMKMIPPADDFQLREFVASLANSR